MRNALSIARLRSCFFARVQVTQAVGDILLGGHVREKREILQHVSYPSLPCRNIPPALRIVCLFPADHDASFVGIGESRNAIEECSFSRPRSAEKNRESGERAEVNIQTKAALRSLTKRLRMRTSTSEEIAGAAGRGTNEFFISMGSRPMDAGLSHTPRQQRKEMTSSTSAVWFALAYLRVLYLVVNID